MEELICKITDLDLGGIPKEMNNPRLRYAARGVIIREDGKIAVFNKSKKNEYKLPGGGLEGEENIEEAFKREVIEETGCEVDIIEKLGIIEENRTVDNFKQISYVFVAKVLKDLGNLSLTQKEKDEGGRIVWETPEKALELIINCYDKLIPSEYESVYHTKFMVLRDRRILEKFIEKNNR